tara:strand:- start:19019 stop:19318 length:300 start_codon:yes stop_codon:yes gene_type:complete
MSNQALLNRVFNQVPLEEILDRCKQELGLKAPRPLQVGDRVRVNIKDAVDAPPGITEEMRDLHDTYHLVTVVRDSGYVRISGDPDEFAWRQEWLELAEE